MWVPLALGGISEVGVALGGIVPGGNATGGKSLIQLVHLREATSHLEISCELDHLCPCSTDFTWQ